MDDAREVARFVEFMVGRMQHLTRLASVTDVRTMARYLAALHYEIRPRVDAVAAALSAEGEPRNITQ